MQATATISAPLNPLMSTGLGLSEVLLFFSFLAGYFFFQSEAVLRLFQDVGKGQRKQQLDRAQDKLAAVETDEEADAQLTSAKALMKSGSQVAPMSKAISQQRADMLVQSTDEGSSGPDAPATAATFGSISSDEEYMGAVGHTGMEVDDEDDEHAESPAITSWRRAQEARHAQTRGQQQASIPMTSGSSRTLPLLIARAPAAAMRVPTVASTCPVSPPASRLSLVPSAPLSDDTPASTPFEHMTAVENSFFSSASQQHARSQLPSLKSNSTPEQLSTEEELAQHLLQEGCREQESAAAWRLVNVLKERNVSTHAAMGAVVRAVHMAAENKNADGDCDDVSATCACTLLAAVMEMSSEVEDGLQATRTLAAMVEADLEECLDDANPPDMSAAAHLAAEGVNVRLFHPARSTRFADMMLARCELSTLSAYLEALSPAFRKYVNTAAQTASSRAGTPFVPAPLRQRLQAAAAAHAGAES